MKKDQAQYALCEWLYLRDIANTVFFQFCTWRWVTWAFALSVNQSIRNSALFFFSNVNADGTGEEKGSARKPSRANSISGGENSDVWLICPQFRRQGELTATVWLMGLAMTQDTRHVSLVHARAKPTTRYNLGTSAAVSSNVLQMEMMVVVMMVLLMMMTSHYGKNDD